MSFRFLFVLFCLQLSYCSVALADIVDFTTWTSVADPAHPAFTASATSSAVTLRADGGPIPINTDVGFQSVNGLMPGSSTSGYFFNPFSDFTIAIDYSLTFGSKPMGFLGLGFGIGEDGAGMNSAGVALATSDGLPMLTFGGAARVNKQDQIPLELGMSPSTLVGSLFVEYDAASGDVNVGAATTQGVAMPTVSGTFTEIQNQWGGGDLLASFFIRSDGAGWQDGTAEAVFSNFRVIEGSPTAVPEPSSLASFGACGVFIMRLICRGRRKRDAMFAAN